MADERIDNYVNRNGVQGDTDFMLAQLNSVYDGFIKVNGVKLTLGKDNSFKAAADDATKLKKANDDLSLSVQAYSKINDQNARIQAQMNAAMSDAGKANAELKLQSQQAAAANKQQAQEALGLIDTYGKLNQQYKEAAANAKNLSAIAQQSGSTGDQAQATAAVAKAKALHDQLLAIDQSVGQSQRNVGNYTGALRVLESALSETNARMAQLVTTGQESSAAFASAQEESILLTALVNKQANGFTSVTTEIRNTERALQTLRAAGLEGTEAFDKLRESTVEANREQKEFQRQQQLLEGEAPLLAGLTLAAKGLAGAYAIGAGAVSLFADGNEKAQKELQKLVAIMTILQGLNEAYKTIQQAGAIATSIKSAAIGAATAVQAAYTTATTSSTVANEALAASTVPVVAGAEGETVAIAGATIAAEGEAVAMTEAAAATTAFSTSLLATGIGAAVAAVAAAIIYLIAKIPDWIKGNEITIKQQGEIADALREANQAMIEQADFITNLDTATKRYYENQIALSNSAGNNREKNFALEKQLNAEEKNLAQESVDQLGATNEQQSRLASTIQILNNRRQEAIEIQERLLAIPTQKQTTAEKDELAAASKNAEIYNKQLAGLKPLFDAGQKARADLAASNLKSDQQDIEQQKFTDDEKRKLILESAKIESDFIISKNEIILSDDRSTQAQRLTALKTNVSERKKVIEAEKNNVLLDPGASSADKVLAEKKANTDLLQVNQKFREDQYNLNESYRLRDLAATDSISQSRIKTEIQANDAIVKNDNNSLGERLTAYGKYLASERELADEEFNTKLKAAGFSQEEIVAIQRGDQVKIEGKKITNRELEALEVEHIDKIKQINDDGGKAVYDITVSWAKKQEEGVLQANKLNDDPATAKARYTQSLVALNQSFEQKQISIERYDAARLKLEDKYQIEVLRISVEGDKKSLSSLTGRQEEIKTAISNAQADLADAYESGNEQQIIDDQARLKALQEAEIQNAADIKAVRQKLADDTLKLTQQTVERQLQYERELKEAKKKLEQETFDFVKTLGDSRYENDINNLQTQIDAVNTLRDAQISAENASSDSAADKANKIIVINATAAAKQAELQRQQKDEKRKEAQFDKELSIVHIAINTAEAVSKDLIGNKLLIPYDIAQGAIEIAAVLATPIPNYKTGTKDHPGGIAEWGHGKREMAITPTGDMIISGSTPEIRSFPKHTVILPDADSIMNELVYNSLYHTSISPQRADGDLRNEINKSTRNIVAAIDRKPVAFITNTHSGVQMGLKSQQRYIHWVNTNMQS